MRRLLSLAVMWIFLLAAPNNILAQGQIVVKGEDEGEWKHPVKTDTRGRLQGVQAQNLLDACDVKTGWTALSNDTTGIDVDLDHVEGAKSLIFDKVDGTDNSVLGGCDKTLTTAVDIAHYMENNGFILVSMNVSATTDIDYCFVRLGTDASNYNEWRVDDDSLAAGWNQIRYSFFSPDTAGNLGNGIAASSVLYLAVGCSFDLETDTLADLRVDNISVNSGAQISADLNSQVSAAVGGTKVDLVKVGGITTNVNGGNRDAGTQTVAVADDDPVAVSVAHLDAWDDGADRANVNVELDTVLDDLDATAGWTVGNDATANIALSANHVRGTGSLTFDKVNGTNFTEAYIQKTIGSVAIDDFETHNVIEWALYVSTLSDVAYVFVRIGTDNANYSEWRVDDDDLSAGAWNPIAMFVGNVEYAVTGTGLNASAITYVAMGASFDLEDDLLAGIGVDDLMIHETNHTTSSISAEVATTVSTANVNLQKVGNKVVDKDIGVSGNGTQRVVNATDDPNLSKLTVEDLDTTGATDNKQVVAIVTQSATGAQLNSSTYPMYIYQSGTDTTQVAVTAQAVGNTATEILGSTAIKEAESWGIQVVNVGGGTGSDLTDADVQVSRDLGTTWTSLTWTACDTLATPANCDYDFPGNSYTHIKVLLTSAVDTTATVNLSYRE